MLKCNGEKPVSSYTIKKQISLCCFYIIFFLIQTSAFAYQETEINPFGLKISLSDDFVVYKDVEYIDENYTDELGNDDLYFCATSELKNMSIQVWKAGEIKYENINSLSDNKISEIMEDVGFLKMAKSFMIESSMEISLQKYNGQKYYIISSYFKEAPSMFGQYMVTINNGYIVWYQIFHYDTFSEKNTKELLECFEFTENRNFYSKTIRAKDKEKEMRIGAIVRGTTKWLIYSLIFAFFGLVKKIWSKVVNKRNDEQEYIEKDVVTDNFSSRNLYNESENENLSFDDQKNACEKYEVCIFDAETKTLRKEKREIDTIKFSPLKYAVNDTYYAIEKIRDAKKIRIYYEKKNWDKQIEDSLQTNG